MRRIELNHYYLCDYTGIERHLEHMAKKGWELQRAGVFFFYKKTPPQNLSYAVTYLPENGYYSPVSEDEQTFDQLSEAAGWEHVGNYRALNIYLNRRPDPIPIDTDPKIKLENLSHAMTVQFLFAPIILLLLLALGMNGLHSLQTDALSFFGNSLLLTFGAILLGVLFCYATDLPMYLIWKRKAEQLAEEGRFTKSPRHSFLLQILFWLETAAILIFNLCSWNTRGKFLLLTILAVILALLITDILRPWFRKKHIPGAINYLIAALLLFLAYMIPALAPVSNSADTAEARGEAYFTNCFIQEDEESTRQILPAELLDKYKIESLNWVSNASCFYGYMTSCLVRRDNTDLTLPEGWSENDSEETEDEIVLTVARPTSSLFYDFACSLVEQKADQHPDYSGSFHHLIKLSDRIILIQSQEELTEEEISFISKGTASL